MPPRFAVTVVITTTVVRTNCSHLANLVDIGLLNLVPVRRRLGLDGSHMVGGGVLDELGIVRGLLLRGSLDEHLELRARNRKSSSVPIYR